MSDRTHTPGPWAVRKTKYEWQVVYWDETEVPGKDEPWIVCGVAGACAGGDEEANALLMSAAPEMLEALELHVAYEALPQDRGGKNGPKGRARAKWLAARDAALARANRED